MATRPKARAQALSQIVAPKHISLTIHGFYGTARRLGGWIAALFSLSMYATFLIFSTAARSTANLTSHCFDLFYTPAFNGQRSISFQRLLLWAIWPQRSGKLMLDPCAVCIC